MVLGAILGAGIGIVGGISVGSFMFGKRRPQDFSFLDADNDVGYDGQPALQPSGPVPKDLREALEFTPMWTRWPDYERVAWVNYAIKVLWPHYNKAITEQVVMSLEPQLKKQVETVGVLEALDIECLDLGNRPIRIGGIKVYETNEDEVIIEAPILWGSNAKIRIAAKIRVAGVSIYVPVEVNDIVLKAESRITIKPLVETLPCLGAVTISLLKEPFVDLCVMVVNRLDLMALPVVRDIAHKTVKNIVGDMLVFPNQMNFDIMENGGRAPEPEGMLTVKLLSGEGMKGSGTQIFSKSEPYVIIEIREGRPVQSAAVNSSDSEWKDEEFHLIVDDRNSQPLTLTVKEDDMGWQDKTLSMVRIPLDGLPFMEHPATTYEVLLNLQKATDVKPKKRGTAGKQQAAPTHPLSQAVKSIRMKTLTGYEDVPVPPDPEVTDPAPVDLPVAKNRAEKIVDRGVLKVEFTFYPFNREAMAEKNKDSGAEPPKQATMSTLRTSSTLRMSSLRVARGVLTVTLTRCINLQGDGSSDPQVFISLYDQMSQKSDPIVQKSTTVFNEASPRWGDKFDFVGISADSFVVFNVKDKGSKDKTGDNKSLGKLRIPVPDVVRNKRIKDVWALQETQQGEIALTLEWKSLQFDEPDSMEGAAEASGFTGDKVAGPA